MPFFSSSQHEVDDLTKKQNDHMRNKCNDAPEDGCNSSSSSSVHGGNDNVSVESDLRRMKEERPDCMFSIQLSTLFTNGKCEKLKRIFRQCPEDSKMVEVKRESTVSEVEENTVLETPFWRSQERRSGRIFFPEDRGDDNGDRESHFFERRTREHEPPSFPHFRRYFGHDEDRSGERGREAERFAGEAEGLMRDIFRGIFRDFGRDGGMFDSPYDDGKYFAHRGRDDRRSHGETASKKKEGGVASKSFSPPQEEEKAAGIFEKNRMWKPTGEREVV
eukprot:g3822.t1